jgi:hypothetical protein
MCSSRFAPLKRVLLAAALVAIPVGLFGCSPDGAGTVDIKDATAARKKMEGESRESRKLSAETKAKNKALEEAAGAKHPKLR